MALLHVSNLHKAFGQRQAVQALSFDLTSGQTLGLIGPNGAGKSTAVHMLCGLLRPDQGEVWLASQRLLPSCQAAKRLIGLVPQDLALWEDLSARENLLLFGALYGLPSATLKRRCAEVLELVQLSERGNDKPATFSGGMKRRLNIAAALLHEPKLLILDEPTVGVDAQSRNAIFDSLEQLKREGCSLIYTSHYMEEVERLADQIVIIDHGHVIADESPAELYRRLSVQAALQVTLLEPVTATTLELLRCQAGVAQVCQTGLQLEIALVAQHQAMPVLAWLASHGCQAEHFATKRTSLEAIFLNLTGRSLRDA